MVAALLTALFTVLLLGGLIFFHELGHYIFARWMGVHVVTFSIGFGPTLFKIRGKQKGELEPTEYVIGILPLGGFVRMLGADPSEPVPDSWREASFQSKAVWKRFLIVAAGPAFNLILPYFIYLIAGFLTAQQVPSWVGTVDVTGAAAAAGLEPGDRIVAIDDTKVDYWWQLEQLISDAPAEKLAFTVERPGVAEPLKLEVIPEGRQRELLPGLAFGDERGRVGVMPAYARPFVIVAEGSPAWQAGLRNGDLVTAVDGKPVERFDQMAAELSKDPATPVRVAWMRPHWDVSVGVAEGFVRRETFDATVAPNPGPTAVPNRGLGTNACAVAKVQERTPAATLGLEPGDQLWSVDGKRCDRWPFLMQQLAATPDQEHTLVFSRGAEMRTLTHSGWLAELTVKGERSDRVVRTFGISVDEFGLDGPDLIPNDARFAFAFTHSIRKTNEAMSAVLAAIVGLIRGKVPTTELSGPIGIAQLVSRTTEEGAGYFFFLMVWLSINLGLINLLPIPILDGGQILFLGIEAVRRRPVSLQTRQIATYIGLAIIILLFVIGMKNDIQRPLG
ncbi:MAG: RIP metalloprotease RseP [Myxococcota bacterium]